MQENSSEVVVTHKNSDVHLGWGERLGFGAGRFGFNMINAVMASFLTIYFTNVALLDAGIISTIIAVSKVFDGVSDIIVGNIVDKTHSKMGKARVWLFRMCIPLAISSVLLMWVPQAWPDMVKYVYVFIMYNVVNAFFLTFMFVPYFSLISFLSSNSYERGFLGNCSEIFSTLGNIAINSFFIVLLARFTNEAGNIYTQQAYTYTMIVIGIIEVICVMITVFTTRERVTEEQNGELDKQVEGAVEMDLSGVEQGNTSIEEAMDTEKEVQEMNKGQDVPAMEA